MSGAAIPQCDGDADTPAFSAGLGGDGVHSATVQLPPAHDSPRIALQPVGDDTSDSDDAARAASGAGG